MDILNGAYDSKLNRIIFTSVVITSLDKRGQNVRDVEVFNKTGRPSIFQKKNCEKS